MPILWISLFLRGVFRWIFGIRFVFCLNWIIFLSYYDVVIGISFNLISDDDTRPWNYYEWFKLSLLDLLSVVKRRQIGLFLTGLLGSIQIEFLIVTYNIESELLVYDLNALLDRIADGEQTSGYFNRYCLFVILIIVCKLSLRFLKLIESQTALDFRYAW